MSPPRPPPKTYDAGTEIGTLVIVVDRARNLVDKQRIGKQSPYVTLCIPSSPVPTKRTQTINRGGQAPEWDAELRFPIMSELEDTMGKSSNKSMTVVCWADDSREPTKVGEAFVDLTRSLTKGEDDLWVPLTLDSKDGGKYRGEVRLEMTFFSNASPPPKKYNPKPAAAAVATTTPTKPPAKRQPRMSAPGPGAAAKMSPAHPSSLRPGPAGAMAQSLRGRQSLSNMPLYRPEYMDGTGGGSGGVNGELRIPSPLPSPQPEQTAFAGAGAQATPVAPYQLPPSPAAQNASHRPPSRQPSPNPYMYQQPVQVQQVQQQQVQAQAQAPQQVPQVPQPTQPFYQTSPGHSPITQVHQPQQLEPVHGQAQMQMQMPMQSAQGMQSVVPPATAPAPAMHAQPMQTTPIPPPRTSPIPPVAQGVQNVQVPQQVPVLGHSPPMFAQYPPYNIASGGVPPAPPAPPAQQNAWSPWQNPAELSYNSTPPYSQTPPQMQYAQTQPPQQPQQQQQSRPLPSAPVIQSPFPQYPPPGTPLPSQPPAPTAANVVYGGMPPSAAPVAPVAPQVAQQVAQQPVMYPNYPPPPLSTIYGDAGAAAAAAAAAPPPPPPHQPQHIPPYGYSPQPAIPQSHMQ